jgi:prepilin-type N-terminal cleavage/methylation domain-containing protein
MSERVRSFLRSMTVTRVRRASSRGFTLMELMVVVLLVAILAVLAIPSITSTEYDRVAYSDAGQLAELFRASRTRALARGAAVVIHFASDTSSNQRGRFEVWEAVTLDATDGGVSTIARTPVSSCKSPTAWTLPNITNPAAAPTNAATNVFIDGVDFNGGLEAEAHVVTAVTAPDGTAVTDAYLCFTPLGHVYYSKTASFDASSPINGVLKIDITMYDATRTPSTYGVKRTVVVPSTGAARVISS